MADIYGANLYNRYLQASHGTKAQMQAKSGGGGADPLAETVEDTPKMTSAELGGASSVYGAEEDLPEGCSSILVCTGVYSRDQQQLPSEEGDEGSCELSDEVSRDSTMGSDSDTFSSPFCLSPVSEALCESSGSVFLDSESRSVRER